MQCMVDFLIIFIENKAKKDLTERQKLETQDECSASHRLEDLVNHPPCPP